MGEGLVYKKKCTSKKKYAAHPYYEHDIESLEEKAEFGKDPLAADVAADRLAYTDASRAVGLAIYSSLVSNKSGPIYDHAQRHFALKDISEDEQRSIRMPTYYSLMKIVKDMGRPNMDLSFADSVPINLRDEWAGTAKKTQEVCAVAAGAGIGAAPYYLGAACAGTGLGAAVCGGTAVLVAQQCSNFPSGRNDFR